MSKEEFRQKYGATNARAFRKAIREEIGGGKELLDLAEFVHLTRQNWKRGRMTDPLDILDRIAERIDTVKSGMLSDVAEMYDFPPAGDGT